MSVVKNKMLNIEVVKRGNFKKTTFPLVSIIVPVYNVEPYIRDCLDSLLAQSYSNIEILLVNDGSTDHSASVCESYNDSRIKIYHKANGGQSTARNLGLEEAKGYFITFIDSDDYVQHTYIERLLDEILNDPELDAVQAGYSKIGLASGKFSQPNKEVLKGDEVYENYLKHSKLESVVVSKLYTKESIGKLRFHEGKTMEDAMFLDYFFAQRHLKVAIIPDILYTYRIRENSTMNRIFDRNHMLSSFYNQNINIQLCKNYYPKLLPIAYRHLYSDLLQYIRLYHLQRINIQYVDLKNSITKELNTLERNCRTIDLLKLKLCLYIPFLGKIAFKR